MRFSGILALLGLSSCSFQSAATLDKRRSEARRLLRARVESVEQPAVLFVGNSYTFGLPKAFAEIAEANGKSVRTGRSAFNGWTLAQHSTNPETLALIRTGNWDVIVFQEHSEIPAMSPRIRAVRMFPPLRRLVSEARDSNSLPVLLQTWGRRDGDRKRVNDDFQKMTNRLREGYALAAMNAGGIPIIPVGDAWEEAVAAGMSSRLFHTDGSHPTEMGTQISAESIFATLFGK